MSYIILIEIDILYNIVSMWKKSFKQYIHSIKSGDAIGRAQ